MFKKIKTIHLLKSFIFEVVKNLTIILLCIQYLFLAQSPKKDVYAKRINQNVKIDGQLDELFWSNINPATNFQMIEPINGKVERSTQRTEVRFAYDDFAIYVGATLNDKNAGYDDPNMVGIMKELGPRDQEGKSTDVFGIFVNPFNDGINEFAFLVTASGVQIDKRIVLTTNGSLEDKNWDAVWESAVKIHKDGWFVEMKIPYSAIRFPNVEEQLWGLNIYREVRRFREEYSWNPIDTRQGKIGNQNGLLKGIANIKPPVRLSFSPYISSSIIKDPAIDNENSKHRIDYSGSIDLKYGFKIPVHKSHEINMTLDMILLPEFQQVEFDPLVLNISPFEVKYDEKRSFFTEGIDLFQKGNLFYSRRIGGNPINSATTNENEIVKNSPENTQLFNGTKISGRTEDGWGIGIFNAVSRNTYAEIQDTILNTVRNELIEPVTNYNMLVIDKSFNQNSFATFINTNVWRKEDFRNANVTALLASLTNKKETYTFDSSVKTSQIWVDQNKKNGFSTFLNIQKISGRFKYNLSNNIKSDEFDINDMGFLYRNNEISNEINFSYNIYSQDELVAKKFGIKKGKLLVGLENKSLYKPFLQNELIIKTELNALNNNHFFTSLKTRYFFEENDYFESRSLDQVFVRPPAAKLSFYSSSNFNKPISLNNGFSLKWRFNKNYEVWKDYKNVSLYYRFNPRFRINNHMFLQYVFVFDYEKNQFGWIAENENEEAVFSRRDQKTYTNKLTFNYTFSPLSYLKLIVRHYWSTIENYDFYDIEENGILVESTYGQGQNINFNTWNLDLNYSWEYKPGSFFSVVLQNQLTKEIDNVGINFLDNINDFFQSPLTNILSFRITYYLDYIDLKK